jgi:Flp pilus assembly protein TadD
MRKEPMRRAILLLCLGLAACGGHDRPPLAKGLTVRVADAALAGGAPVVALQVAREILARHPNDATLVREGDALFAMEHGQEAATSYQRALALEPRNNSAQLGLGRIRLRTDPAGAEAIFLRLLAADPLNAAALNDLGIARDLQGRHAAAQEAYAQAAAAAPEMAAAQVHMGLSLALSGNSSRAVDILRPLAASASATPRVRQDLAVALVVAGDDQGARQVLRTDLNEGQTTDAVSGYERLRQSPAHTN